MATPCPSLNKELELKATQPINKHKPSSSKDTFLVPGRFRLRTLFRLLRDFFCSGVRRSLDSLSSSVFFEASSSSDEVHPGGDSISQAEIFKIENRNDSGGTGLITD